MGTEPQKNSKTMYNMVNSYMLVIRDCKLKSLCHATPVSNKTSRSGEIKKGNHCSLFVGSKSANITEGSMKMPQNPNVRAPYNPGIPFLGAYPTEVR